MEKALLSLLEKTRRIGTWNVELNGSIVHWSPATYAIHDEDPDKALSLDEAIQYYIPEHRPIIQRCIDAAIRDNKTWDIELQLLTARGARRWVRAIGEPIYEGKDLIGLHGIFEDIHQRKSLEVDRESLMERMFEGERIGKLGHWSWDVENDSREWAPGVHRIFGSSASGGPLTLAQHMALVVPEDRASLKQHMLDILASVQTEAKEFKLGYRVLVDGTEKYLESQGFPKFDVDGKFIEFSGVIVDRTSEFESRREIEELHRRLVLALDASGVGVWDWDIQSDVLIWDDQMYALYGIEADDFSGAFEAWQNGLHPEDRQSAEEEIQQAIAQKEKFFATFRVVWPVGTVRNLQGIADVILNAHGEPERMIGVYWDITDAVAVRSELERSNYELAQFAYRTSHDLKGPLTSIRRVAEYMVSDIDSGELEEAKCNTSKIIERADAMESMVLGILDAAKAELTVTVAEPIDLEGIASEILENTQAIREEMGVAVEVDIDCAVQPRLPHIRIYQILYNLTSNGIKYANKARDKRFVALRAVDQSDHLELSVEDNGLGIPDVDEDAPFEMFKRFHSGVSGSGLGLYIVKKHVESLGGSISLTTGASGSRFELKIPYARRES
ncbi:MAG: PAS domain-containing protein [Woeseiaceae bacterium]